MFTLETPSWNGRQSSTSWMPQTSPASVFFADAPYRSVFAPCLAVKRKGRCPVTEASQGVQVAERYESPKHVRDHVRRKKFRTFSNWFAQRLFPQRGEKTGRAPAGSAASRLHALKAHEHVIPDRPQKRQVRNALVYSAQQSEHSRILAEDWLQVRWRNCYAGSCAGAHDESW